MTAGRFFSPLSGNTVTIFTPMWRSTCQAGISNSVAVLPLPNAMSW